MAIERNLPENTRRRLTESAEQFEAAAVALQAAIDHLSAAVAAVARSPYKDDITLHQVRLARKALDADHAYVTRMAAAARARMT